MPHMVSYTAIDGGVAPKEGTDLGKVIGLLESLHLCVVRLDHVLLWSTGRG